MKRTPSLPIAAAGLALIALVIIIASGCALVEGAGGVLQNIEYQKKLRVPPQYDGLAGKTVAILVDVNETMMYEHPTLSRDIADGVAFALQNRTEDKLPGISVINPRETLAWQYRTPGWNLMRYGEIAQTLEVERVVILDIYEYRLNPPGNRYQWQGVCAANVRVIENEEDTFDPDIPEEFNVIAQFPPPWDVVPWESAPASRIHAGLLLEFYKRVAWLFYEHEEPKYPDKYRPEQDTS